ncbi:MAG: glycosyltransferase family 4 protein [Ornithinimicrobium sp.]
MRVLAVTTWLPTREHPSTGAFVVKDARAIADLGHEVALIHLVAPHQVTDPDRPHRPIKDALRAQEATVEGIPVTRLPMSTTSPRQIAAAGARLARLSAGADLVHSMAFSALLPMTWWRPVAPWVHTEHWSGLTTPQTLPRTWQATLPTLRPLLRRPDVVTAVCDQLADPVRQVRGDRPTAVVPCIVPAPSELHPRRPQVCAGSPREIALVFVGALVDRKGPLLAVDTVAELASRGVRATLRVVGQGPLAAQVTRRADEQGVGDRIELVGTLDRAGVLGELAAADVFLGPTRGENFFVACAEAVQSGRPVVVGATGGHVEYLDPRVGVCVPDQDPRAYADAVGEVLDRCQGMSAERISATIGASFSAEVVAAKYQGVYDLAVDCHGRGGE